MIKNLPLLLAMIVLGHTIVLLINQAQLPDEVFWILTPVSLILNVWGLIGIVLHLWVRKMEG